MSEVVNVKDVEAFEALKLYAKGVQLCCPRCKALLTSIPKNLPSGSIPFGLMCPTDHKHYYIYGEGDGRRLIREGLSLGRNLASS